MVWKKYNGSVISGDILNEVEQTLSREKAMGFRTHICIGTDSQVTSGVTEFATVIVFIRERAGGFMFITKEKTRQIFGLKERMITEVSKSVNVAYMLQPVLEKLKVRLEVHADINADPSYKSHAAFAEAMGYIKGMGYDFKAKPDAFASSYCADKVI
ncbi:ribonuclease H-like YkuK family protein [Portibacter marinus]|uniref:ribonuclease H-like YkuK family protein n=1 Tax=Portibacter marinus TaxID=2898660 RepID=UPI001F3ED288|nr:ribonuclease H-like YkuK family protein [Portibacter marinus]